MARAGLVRKQITDKRGKRTSVWVRVGETPKAERKKKFGDFLGKKVNLPKNRGVKDEVVKGMREYTYDSVTNGTNIFVLLSETKSGWAGEETRYRYSMQSPRIPSVKEHKFDVTFEGDDRKYPHSYTYDSNVIDITGENDRYEINKDIGKNLKNGWKLVGDVFDSRENDKEFLFRGMGESEMRSIVDTGYIQTNGSGNIGDQGLTTFFSSQNQVASSYAGGFAMWHREATYAEPSYIVKVRKEHISEYDENGDTGYEVGVNQSIRNTEIAEVWEVRPSFEQVDLDGGYIEFMKNGETVREGSRFGGSRHFVTKRVM